MEFGGESYYVSFLQNPSKRGIFCSQKAPFYVVQSEHFYAKFG